MSHVGEIPKASLIFGPIFAILFGLSIRSLYLGFTKYDECPLQPLLPQGLLWFGLIGLICSIVALILIIVSFFKVDDSGTQYLYLLGSIVVVFVYGMSATIFASVIAFVLRIKYSDYQSEDPNDTESFCHASVYNFCSVFATAVIPLASTFLIWLIRFLAKRLMNLKVKFN